jgi:hypothetical protein
LLKDTISQNQRLLHIKEIQGSKRGDRMHACIFCQWNYVVENQCKVSFSTCPVSMACRVFFSFHIIIKYKQMENDGMIARKCPNRAESPAMDSKSQSLVLMNFFTTY